MSDAKTYKGSCFCGAVQFTVSGEPTAMGYCHCESCRSWSAAPVNGFTLWKQQAGHRATRASDYESLPKLRGQLDIQLRGGTLSSSWKEAPCQSTS